MLKIFIGLKSHRFLIGVFVFCWAYWSYLIFASEMVIRFDAIGYQDLGLMIYKQGWKTFFETGPHREPLYPWFVAISMNIADILSVSFQFIQKLMQVTILFVTQLILLALLKKARIHEGIIGITLLYFGFSPAIVNSAFSLYSEIAVFPAVLIIVWAGVYVWRAIHQESVKRVVVGGVLTALGFIWATSGKGIFQYIFLVFLVPFVRAAVVFVFQRNIVRIRNSMLFFMIVFLTFGSFVVLYRYANKRFNGNFEFTNRYDGNLFGTAAKRVNQLSPQLVMAHLASVPGGGVCRIFFSEEICKYCEFEGMDHYRLTELPQLLQERGVGTSAKERTNGTISLAFEKIIENSIQYFALTVTESLKMAFWESTQIGYVVYPAPLKWFFDFAPFKNGIRFLLSSMTYFSLFYLIFHVYKGRSKLGTFELDGSSQIQIGFFVLLIVISFTGLYALFSILTRFALPIAALYMFCIAFAAQDLIFGASRRAK